MQMFNPAHPGRILAYYLQGRSVTEVAKHLGVTRPALSRVLNGKASVSADMALRISEAFNTDPELWLRLQAQRDLMGGLKEETCESKAAGAKPSGMTAR